MAASLAPQSSVLRLSINHLMRFKGVSGGSVATPRHHRYRGIVAAARGFPVCPITHKPLLVEAKCRHIIRDRALCVNKHCNQKCVDRGYPRGRCMLGSPNFFSSLSPGDWSPSLLAEADGFPSSDPLLAGRPGRPLAGRPLSGSSSSGWLELLDECYRCPSPLSGCFARFCDGAISASSSSRSSDLFRLRFSLTQVDILLDENVDGARSTVLLQGTSQLNIS
ncbi:hypothetical protein KSP40_PGU008287 [Platanthera guangdongensis]|uniref:Uncharacterized protein n=1 Tax=Platanthera guangdongensis TaxID=2320717 RepID=A0ABR2MC94_9ASPA